MPGTPLSPAPNVVARRPCKKSSNRHTREVVGMFFCFAKIPSRTCHFWSHDVFEGERELSGTGSDSITMYSAWSYSEKQVMPQIKFEFEFYGAASKGFEIFKWELTSYQASHSVSSLMTGGSCKVYHLHIRRSGSNPYN